MKQLSEMSLTELISPKGIECACGKNHCMAIDRVEIGAKTIELLPDILEDLHINKPFLISDQNTAKAAFKYLLPVLEENNIKYESFQFFSQHLEPDEESLGGIAMNYDPSCDGILAVGSGVINDLGKAFSYVTQLPQISIATAPSMDGYGSNNASMIQNRLKVSLYYECPRAIVADTRILQEAPFQMLQAGVGDMLAKYVSLTEWRISNLITNEYYCDNIAELIRSSLKDILEVADDLLKRDAEAIEKVFIGLLYTGLAMGYAGISRPASGLEHYFSHVWEMMSLERNKAVELHGIQVAIGTLLTFQIWQKLKLYQPNKEKAEEFIKSFDQKKWELMLKRVYGQTASQEIIKTAIAEDRNCPKNHAKRLEIIISKWPKILEIVAEEMPSYQYLLEIMEKLDMPLRPEQIGFTAKDTHDALIASREVRNKYVSSSLLWDLGLLYEIEFPEESGFKGLD